MAKPLVRNLRDGTLTINDGDSNTLVVVLDEGNLEFSETRNVIQVKNRGVLDHLRSGDEEAVTVSFTGRYLYLLKDTGDTDETVSVREALLKKGGASGWASTGVTGEPYQVELVFEVANPGGVKDETITFAHFAVTRLTVGEGAEADTIRVEGIDYETEPAIARAV